MEALQKDRVGFPIWIGMFTQVPGIAVLKRGRFATCEYLHDHLHAPYINSPFSQPANIRWARSRAHHCVLATPWAARILPRAARSYFISFERDGEKKPKSAVLPPPPCNSTRPSISFLPSSLMSSACQPWWCFLSQRKFGEGAGSRAQMLDISEEKWNSWYLLSKEKKNWE